MTQDELDEWEAYANSPKGKKDKEKCSQSAWIAFRRVKQAQREFGLNDAKEVADRTEGKPIARIEQQQNNDQGKIFDQLRKITQQAIEEDRAKNAINGEVVIDDQEQEMEIVL